MRHGFMGMMLKPRCSRRIGWEKGLLDQKKHGWVGQRSRCCWLCSWLERHCPSWIHTTWSDGKQTVVPGNISALEGCCAWIVGKSDLDVAPRQCTGSRVAPHLQLSGKRQTSVVPYPPYSPDLALVDSFLFPILEPLWKDVVSKP